MQLYYMIIVIKERNALLQSNISLRDILKNKIISTEHKIVLRHNCFTKV